MAVVEIVEAAEGAHLDDLVSRFMIAGQHVDLVAAAFQNLAVAVDAFVPCTLIAVGDVEIGFHREQFLEPLPIVVNVGEEQEFHGWAYLRGFCQSSAGKRAKSASQEQSWAFCSRSEERRVWEEGRSTRL